MKKVLMVVICLLIQCGFVFADTPGQKPAKTKFDWKKAEGERQKMREKFRAEHKKYIEKLQDFNKRFAAAKSEAEKNAVRVELQNFLTADFKVKIEYSKKRIESMKKFVAKLEEEQKNMEANAPEIVKKRTEEVLQGKIMPPRKKRSSKK